MHRIGEFAMAPCPQQRIAMKTACVLLEKRPLLGKQTLSQWGLKPG
ncbi:MAG: hypothetical protein ACE1ZA_06865 [Pseudomonadales bacterium]